MGFKVGEKYRTNELSFIPGGYTIEVQKTNGKRLNYNNIKYPRAYQRKLERDPDILWTKVL